MLSSCISGATLVGSERSSRRVGLPNRPTAILVIGMAVLLVACARSSRGPSTAGIQEAELRMIPEIRLRRVSLNAKGVPRCIWVMVEEVSQEQMTELIPEYPEQLASSLAASWLHESGPTHGALVPEDLTSPELPAMFVSLRRALEFANLVSIRNGYHPLYDLRAWDEFREIERRGENGFRLPTAAEWLAISTANLDPDASGCAVGNALDQSGAAAIRSLGGPVFECVDGFAGLAPGGSFPRGEVHGLLDLYGNVSEWTESPLQGQLAILPRGFPPYSGAVVCGTSFMSGPDSANSCFAWGSDAGITIGLRLVVTGLDEQCP